MPAKVISDSTVYLAQQPDIYRSICSIRDKLGFGAEIQAIFGTVYDQAVLSIMWPPGQDEHLLASVCA